MCGLFCYVGKAPIEISQPWTCLAHRGPDFYQCLPLNPGVMVFYRLTIMDRSANGNQPFCFKDNLIVCNGEIYNNKILRKKIDWNVEFISESDCEVILPMIDRFGLETSANALDGEFAFIVYNKSTGQVSAARDPIGIRPLFYGFAVKDGKIAFASEAKALSSFCRNVMPFPPGHIYENGRFTQYHHSEALITSSNEQYALEGINQRLVEAVRKRLISDAPVGFLLSGGLDSSLVCAIAQRELNQPIRTFSIGISDNPIDVPYAEKVATHIGSEHRTVLFSEKDIEDNLDGLIRVLETWDITTVRASIGMYLICKYIREKTDVKVVLTGEVSDELFGYKYTDFAPNPESFQQEAEKRVNELYMYDVLRADRCIAAHGLEARVPFSDKSFVRYVMGIDPALKINKNGIGKYLLRKAFDGDGLLPEDVLYREKAAFSDAVGHRSVDFLKELAESKYADSDLEQAKFRYSHCPPFTKEALMYREIFEKHFPDRGSWIKDFWMPNKEWEGCNVDDPSARVLSNYGKSGE